MACNKYSVNVNYLDKENGGKWIGGSTKWEEVER